MFEYVYLNTKNAEDDEKSTTNKNNVADGLERCDEGLDYQLQPRCSADHSAGERVRESEEGKRLVQFSNK